jgi:hypothetical protein
MTLKCKLGQITLYLNPKEADIMAQKMFPKLNLMRKPSINRELFNITVYDIIGGEI